MRQHHLSQIQEPGDGQTARQQLASPVIHLTPVSSRRQVFCLFMFCCTSVVKLRSSACCPIPLHGRHFNELGI